MTKCNGEGIRKDSINFFTERSNNCETEKQHAEMARKEKELHGRSSVGIWTLE
jgi:hypothetical protein